MRRLQDMLSKVFDRDERNKQTKPLIPRHVDIINAANPIVGTVNDWKHDLLRTNLLQDAIPASKTRISSDHEGLKVSLPLLLRPGLYPKGVDLRLQLISIRLDQPESPHVHDTDPPSLASAKQDDARALAPLHLVDRAAGMLMARVLFPNATRPALDAATTVWAVTAITKAALTYGSILQKNRSSRTNTVSSQTNWRKHVSSAWSASLQVAQQYGEPAAVLAFAGMAWALIQPSSCEIAQCMAALVPVLAGYGETARVCATGAVTNKEEEWHRRHKWAAIRCAHMLPSELPDSAPLQPIVQAVQSLCICIGAVVSDPDAPHTILGAPGRGILSTWGAGADLEGVNFWASASLGGPKPKPAAPADEGPDLIDLAREIYKNRKEAMADQEGLATPPSSSIRTTSLMDSPSDWHEASTSSPGTSSEDRETMETAAKIVDGVIAVCQAAWIKVQTQDCGMGSSIEEVEEEEVAGLALYGRGDHTHLQGQRQLTVGERGELGVRALQLMWNFAPFLLLGTFLLLFSRCLPDSAQPVQGSTSEASRSRNTNRLATLRSAARNKAWQLLLKACRQSGAAFIKWGQWSSTREDIFPEDFCRVLSELHDQAPEHTYEETRLAIEAAYGKTLEELFLTFEPNALASGSIAQVHRATMQIDGEVHNVAVKVRHPGVGDTIRTDFQLLRPIAALTSRVRSLKGLNLEDSVSQFSHTMTAQTDLRVEAAHIRRFYRNFYPVRDAVVVPRALPGYQSESVLIETFEAGRSVSHYIRTPGWMNTHIVALGVDTYLKMLLQDNFVHTDLHPGNILVRTVPRPQHAQHPPHAQPSQLNQDERGQSVQIVLLDFGLAEELTPNVRKHFVGFLFCIASGDGVGAAEHLLHWGVKQKCPDPAAFKKDIVTLFKSECDVHAEAGIDLDAVMKEVLHLARKHEVSIDSNYAALVIGVCVIVGFATALDKRVNLMDAAIPCFLNFALTGRVAGRLYM